MGSIFSQIVMILVNRELSDGSVNWPRVRRRDHPQYPVMAIKCGLCGLKCLLVPKLPLVT